jgi:hypothetical protein
MFVGSQNAEYIRALADAAMACPIGETITYAQFSRAVGFPVQSRFYLLLNALNLANAESGALFQNTRTVGYKRLPGSMTAAAGKTGRRRIRRIASRANKTMANALSRANDLTNEDRLKAFKEQAALGLLQHMARDRNLPVVREDAPVPALNATVRASVAALRKHLTSVYG